MNAIVVVTLVVVLSGCASNSNAVRCDGRLEPINTAARTLARGSSIAPPAENEKGKEDGHE